jgi:peroxiredoxin
MSDHSNPLEPGTEAPAWHLKSTPDQTVKLSDFRGRNLIMAFYPADWSPVCTDQMALYNEILPEFKRFGAEQAYARALGLDLDASSASSSTMSTLPGSARTS